MNAPRAEQPSLTPALTHRLRRQEYAEETRAALLIAARTVFSTRGYVDASLIELAGTAQLTTGALYHHFHGKAQLFREVAEAVSRELHQAALDAADAQGTDLSLRLRASVRTLLEAAIRPENYRIVFADARVFLGNDGFRDIERRYAYGFLLELLAELSQAEMLRAPSDLVAAALWGALTESAANIVASPDRERALADGSSVLELVLETFVRTPRHQSQVRPRFCG